MTDALTVRAENTAPCACCSPPAGDDAEIRELQRQRQAVERRLAELDARRD